MTKPAITVYVSSVYERGDAKYITRKKLLALAKQALRRFDMNCAKG